MPAPRYLPRPLLAQNQAMRVRLGERRHDGDEASLPKIAGYGAVYYDENNPGTQYRIYDDVFERIMPGAFDNAVTENDDARSLFNHDRSLVLGRRSSGTLSIGADQVGLFYEADPPPSDYARNLVELIRRGDVAGSSFGFDVFSGVRGRVEWTSAIIDGREIEIRQIFDLELLDVGPVTFEAYEATTTGTRDERDRLETELAAWRREKRNGAPAAAIDHAGRARAVHVSAAAMRFQ